MDAPRLMRPGDIRTLTPGERALTREVFAGAIDLARLRLFAIPLWRRAFVPNGGWIVWPGHAAPQDFAAVPLGDQAVFVHELTHVWQAQCGVNLILGKVRAGDGAQAYDYDLSETGDFRSLNIEQQAMVVQDAFLAARGVRMAYESAAYSAILATWPGSPWSSPQQV
jgi:hypothetical protein